MEEYLIEERLDIDKHFREVSNFSCGHEPLDLFLNSESFKYNEDGQGNTYLIKLKSTNEIVGYYTLKTNAIQAYNENEKRVEALPSIEIARLAVNHKYRENGFGTTIFTYYIIPKINNMKSIVGINTIMVFVEDEEIEDYEKKEKKQVKYFYRTLGFKLAEDEVQQFIRDDYNEGCKLMYMSTSELNEIEEEINDKH